MLDASYALAPEHPFPSALEDAQDLILHVLQHPDVYDAANMVLSGFSSGGNLALAAATDLKRHSQLPSKAIRAVVSFYPPTNMVIHPAEKKLLDGTLPPVPALLRFCMGTFRAAMITRKAGPALAAGCTW